MPIDWNEKYRIGNKFIDDQHEELFRNANRFLVASTLDEQRTCAMKFRQYTKEHFGQEEMLMHDINYPFIATHLRQHDGLIARLASITEQVEHGALSQPELEEFINYWFVKHIAAFDAPLAIYVKRYQGG